MLPLPAILFTTKTNQDGKEKMQISRTGKAIGTTCCYHCGNVRNRVSSIILNHLNKKQMKNVLIIFAVLLMSSTQKQSSLPQGDDILISQIGETNGRKTYTATFSDGTAMDNMYAEEVANMLITEARDASVYNQHLILVDSRHLITNK